MKLTGRKRIIAVQLLKKLIEGIRGQIDMNIPIIKQISDSNSFIVLLLLEIFLIFI